MQRFWAEVLVLQPGCGPAYLKGVLVVLMLKKLSLAVDDTSYFPPVSQVGTCNCLLDVPVL